MFKTTKERVWETQERWKKQERLSPSEVEVLLTEEEEIRTWLEFEQWAERFGDCWSFRGHADELWLLQTAYHRTTNPRSDLALGGGGTIRGRRNHDPGGEHEKRIFHMFQDQHTDITGALEMGDCVGRMQHCGIATRLLDWTRDRYVALFFALERLDSKQKAAIWAIDWNWLRQRSIATLTELCPSTDWNNSRNLDNYTWESLSQRGGLLGLGQRPLVVPVEPPHPDQRMIRQKGHSLCDLTCLSNPTPDGCISWNIWWMMRQDDPDPTGRDRPFKRVIVSPNPRERKAILKELEEICISREWLFPPSYDAEPFNVELRSSVEAERLKLQEEVRRQDRSAGGPTPS